MVRFDASTHTYYDENGNVLISVTQLLKKHSITPDLSHVNPVVLAAKAGRGTFIHKEIEDYNKTGLEGFSEECQYFIQHIAPKYKAIHSEMVLYSDKLAGTADLIMLDQNDDLWIADIKTGQIHKEAVRWQLSLYKFLYLYMQPQAVNTNIHLAVFDAKETDSKFYEVDEIPENQIKDLLRCEFEDDTVYATDCTALDASLVEKAVTFEKAIASLEAQKKSMDAEYKAIKDQIQAAMHNGGIKNFKTDSLSITLKDSYDRTTVDSKKLQDKFPEVFECCKKTSKVSESLVITVKEAV